MVVASEEVVDLHSLRRWKSCPDRVVPLPAIVLVLHTPSCSPRRLSLETGTSYLYVCVHTRRSARRRTFSSCDVHATWCTTLVIAWLPTRRSPGRRAAPAAYVRRASRAASVVVRRQRFPTAWMLRLRLRFGAGMTDGRAWFR